MGRPEWRPKVEVEMRNPIDSFTVSEVNSTDECWVGVYTSDADVLVAFSRKSDGECEISLREQEVRRLIAAFETALDTVNKKVVADVAPHP